MTDMGDWMRHRMSVLEIAGPSALAEQTDMAEETVARVLELSQFKALQQNQRRRLAWALQVNLKKLIALADGQVPWIGDADRYLPFSVDPAASEDHRPGIAPRRGPRRSVRSIRRKGRRCLAGSAWMAGLSRTNAGMSNGAAGCPTASRNAATLMPWSSTASSSSFGMQIRGRRGPGRWWPCTCSTKLTAPPGSANSPAALRAVGRCIRGRPDTRVMPDSSRSIRNGCCA